MDRVEVRRGRYFDSVRLMQASAAVEAVSGVERALVAMGTDLNRSLLAGLGFATPDLGPDDLVLAVRGADEAALTAALTAADAALASSHAAPGTFLDAPAPRRVGAAAEATFALISVPGEHAFVEAMEALQSGMSVMVFSDNVPLAQEVALKQEAARRGLLVMGPGAGTAIVRGIGLGFANAVRPGRVGIVGASGTGIQGLCCLLDDAGVGVRHALGTGSRDLSDEVGGASTLAALQALAADPDVEVIAVVSKPPGPEAAERVRQAAAACGKPAAVAFMGEHTLEEAAAEVLRLLGRPVLQAYTDWAIVEGPHRPGRLLGLFSGGTLRDEARTVAGAALGEISTEATAAGHTMLDLGDEEHTRGRPHPMIDHRTRLDFLARAAADASVGVLLLDVVLGYGAHPDPASALAAAVADVVAAGAAAVVSLCGTAGDPQDRESQAKAFAAVGASVLLSNAAAARHAARLAGGRP
jgi:FdrA protein